VQVLTTIMPALCISLHLS